MIHPVSAKGQGMEVVFGVKLSSIEEAYVWVEQATGLVAQARENDAWGGNYYAFERHRERVLLVNNSDPIDGEPIRDFPNWSIILCAEVAHATSPVLQRLENDSEHFERLSSET
jgi:hypothetical protein